MNRKYQLILIITIGFMLSVLLYFKLNKKNDYVLFMGDSLLINDIYINDLNNELQFEKYKTKKDYLIENITTSELNHLIINNATLVNKPIQADIHNAKYIILSIGYDEITKGSNVRIYLYNLENIIKTIKRINKGNIYLVGMPNKYHDINYWLRNIATKYKVGFLTVD